MESCGAAARDEHNYDVMKENSAEEAKKVLKPEFVNRLDDLIVFHTLTKPDLIRIVDLEVAKVKARIKLKEIISHAGRRGARIPHRGRVTTPPTEAAARCAAPWSDYLEDPLAEELLRRKHQGWRCCQCDGRRRRSSPSTRLRSPPRPARVDSVMESTPAPDNRD